MNPTVSASTIPVVGQRDTPQRGIKGRNSWSATSTPLRQEFKERRLAGIV